MRSAYAAPTTFGVISEKIRIASAMATPPTISDDLALSEQARGDHRGQRGRDRVDQRVAEQDDAEQLVGAGEQSERDFGAAFAALRPEPQPMPIDGHHRRLGDREKSRNRKQRDQRR